MPDFATILRSLKGARGKPADIAARIEALQRQREDVETAPITREEAKELMRKRVGDNARPYAASLRLALNRVIYHPGQEADPEFSHVPRPVFAVQPQAGVAPSPLSLDSALCALLSAQIVPALEAAIDDLEWPANARPQEGRAEEIAKIDKELAALFKARDEILELTNQVGVELMGDTKIADPRRRPRAK